MESNGTEGPSAVVRWLALSLLATLAASVLLATEAYLEHLQDRSSHDLLVDAARTLGVPFDARDGLTVVRDLRARDSSAMFFFGVNGYARALRAGGGGPLLPLTGPARATTVTCNEDGHWASYMADRHGFNNPDSMWTVRPDLVLIGDSFAAGSCVDGGNDVGADLRRLGRSTLDLGNGGNGPLLDAAVFLEYGLPARPRYVIWEFFDNDVDDLVGELANPAIAAYLPPGRTQGLMSREAERDSLVRAVYARATARPEQLSPRPSVGKRLRMLFTLYAIRQLVGQATLASRPQVDAQTAATIRRIVSAARDSLAAHDGTLVVSYFPSWAHFKHDVRLSRDLRDSLAAISRGLGVPFLDVEGSLRSGGDFWTVFELRDAINTHYSVEGYRRVAVGMDAFLRSLPTKTSAANPPATVRRAAGAGGH